MKCVTFAIKKWLNDGGYLCIRRCKTIPFLPHFLWSKRIVPGDGPYLCVHLRPFFIERVRELEGCEHITTDDEARSMKEEIWFLIRGKHYAKKYSD